MPFFLTYDGEISDDHGLVITKVNRSILPPLTDRTVEIPNRIGHYFFRMDMGMRIIPVEIVLIGTELADIQEKKRKIAKWLDPTKGLRDLIFSDEPDKKWEAVISGETGLDEIVRMGKGTLNFLVPNALALSTTSESFLIATAGMLFERNSDAYNPNTGSGRFEKVTAHIPRFYSGFATQFPETKKLFFEKGTTNKLKSNISSAELSLQFNDDTLFYDSPTRNSTFIRDSTTAAHGNFSAKLTTHEAGNISIFQFVPVAALPNVRYSGTVFFKSTNITADIQVGLVFFKNDLTVIGSFGSGFYHSDGSFFQQAVAVATSIDPATAFVRVELLMIGANPGDILWWDAAMIEVVPANEAITTWHLGNGTGNATRENEVAKVFQGKGLMNDDKSSFFVRFMMGKNVQRKQTIFKTPTAVPAFSDYEIYIDGATDQIKLVYGTGAAYTTLTSLTTITLGIEHSLGWRHVQSTGEMTLIIDGVAEATGVGCVAHYDPTEYSFFGSDAAGNTSECLFQELAIWHDSLSDAEFLSIHNAVSMPSTSVRPGNLMNYYSLNGNIGGMQDQRIIEGTSPTFPIFTSEMTRAFHGFKIEHQDTGKFIEIDADFNTGDELIINCETNKVMINGANAINKVTIASDFFGLPPDSTPTFIVTPPDAGDVLLTYTPRWL